MHDDDSAGHALGALADEPVPMARTSVDEVIRKGKRRLRVQRVATVGGAAAVVAVIAATTLLVRPGAPGNDVPVASQPTAPSLTNALSGYTPVAAPPGPRTTSTLEAPPTSQTGQGPPPSAPNRTTTTTTTRSPISMTTGIAECAALSGTPKNVRGLSPKTLTQQFLRAYFDATQRNPVAVRPKPDEVIQRVIIDDRTGELVLDLWLHPGTPLEAANTAFSDTPECSSPRRKTLPDGTVMQLYARGRKEQILHVFAPSGRTYALTLIPDTGWPMSEEQLAVVADELAKLG